MPPIRRYVRISKYSVLECRIFMENPADGPRWLLGSNDPALPRVIEAVRPLILPKLREENDRAKGKGKKQKRVKDVITKDDFDVSIFLTPVGTRHALLTKAKTFERTAKTSSTSQRLTGSDEEPMVIRAESDDEDAPVPMDQIPLAGEQAADEDGNKKVGFKTTYEGFGTWGWVLCLLVTRKGVANRKQTDKDAGQALMEEWIASTQEQEEEES